MGKCVIFCAGAFHGLTEPVLSDDYILAADGGLRHVQQLGLTPHGILGDFDSLGYVPQGAQVFPVEKDDTDSMLAVRQGLAMGYRQFVFYGALEGQRLDHTVANLQALQFVADWGGVGFMVGQYQCATVISNATARFAAPAEGIVSVFCMGGDAAGVTLKGLQYCLEDATLTAGYPLGVSNHFIGNPSEITAKNGSLLIFYPREVSHPEVTPC